MFRKRRASRGALTSWFRRSRAAAAWTLVTVVGGSIIGLVTSDASWLGASDERVAQVAVDTYADFLRRVAGAIVQVAVVEWLFLAAIMLGISNLVAPPPRSRARGVFGHL